MISPAAFIPLAEEIGFIVPMGERVIELGIRIAMDDFGTGYSSLTYLQAFRSTRSRSTARS